MFEHFTMKPSIVFYLIGITIIVFLIFVPAFTVPSQHKYEPTPSNDMTFLLYETPINFYMACSACVAVSVPLFFDFILDIIYSTKSMDYFERFIIAICVSAPKLLFIFYPNGTHKLFYGYCLQVACDTLKVFMNISVYSQQDEDECHPPSNNKKRNYTAMRMAVMFVIYIVAVCLQHYDSLLKNVHTPLSISDPLWLTAFGMYICETAYYLWRSPWKSKNISTSQRNKYYISLSHLLMPLCLGTAVQALQIQYYDNTWLKSGNNFFTVYFLVDTLITIILTMLPGRLARNEAMETNDILETKRAFVRFVSHEIRSPLNVVKGGLSVLEKLVGKVRSKVNVDNREVQRILDDFQTNVADIYAASLTAIEILNDLLNYEKMDAGLFEVKLQRVPSEGIFENHLSSFINFAKSKDINIEIKDDDGLIYRNDRLSAITAISHTTTSHSRTCSHFLNVDPHCIDIVMRNLMTNAVKFTPAGGIITIRIYITSGDLTDLGMSVNPRKEFLCVEVTDTGAGIDESNLGHLFGEFEQFDNRKLQDGGGSGLGLWICRNIINQHGGKIGAMSGGSGQGSTFYFQLPILSKEYGCSSSDSIGISIDSVVVTSCHIQEDHCYSQVNTVEVRLPQNSNRNEEIQDDIIQIDYWKSVYSLRFLVVDDSLLNRKMLIRLLRTEIEARNSNVVLEFIEAADGDIGINLLKASFDDPSRKRIDCVLIDNIMVNMNGPEAVKAMRDKLNYSGLIIGITGNALREDLEYFESCGCNKALSKPIDCESLLDKIARCGVGISKSAEVNMKMRHITEELV